MATPGCRSRVRVRRWWRSSRSPSSPPRSGSPPTPARRYVGHALELRHRLPRVWRRVVKGDLRPYLARRVADQTLSLSPEAASFVDRHVAPVAHKIGPVQLERLVDEAIATHMPDLAEERRLAKADGRYFTVEAQQVSYDGTSAVHGELDLADALDLEHAIAGLAAQLKDLGSEDSLDVRRAAAVGELARAQLALDLTDDTSVVEEGAPHPSRNHHHRPKRQVMLYVHLSRAAVDRRRRHRPARAGQPADHRRPGPRLVPHRRQRRREAGDGPRGPRPRRLTTSSPTGTPRSPRSGTGPACSPGAPGQHAAATPTTPSPHAAADPPARATWPRCAGDTTGSRPTATGPTPPSNPGCISGPPNTATSTSATPTAPSTSPPTAVVSRQALRAFLNHRTLRRSSYRAPDPAARGAIGTPIHEIRLVSDGMPVC